MECKRGIQCYFKVTPLQVNKAAVKSRRQFVTFQSLVFLLKKNVSGTMILSDDFFRS